MDDNNIMVILPPRHVPRQQTKEIYKALECCIGLLFPVLFLSIELDEP